MPLKYLTAIMKQCSRSFSTHFRTKSSLDVQLDYENAVKALNTLQSNADYLKARVSKEQMCRQEEYANTISCVQKFLLRADISFETLDTLPVIHVTGTKGKGSTCALCESILRHHGFRTGFYSSPHLLEVRERICINGMPISKQDFSNHFWEIYNKLYERKFSATDMPRYFTFLTIMAFKIFLMERVDVAIIEVGIGGEYDCTNVLRKVPVVGITSLGLDHTSVLGNTIEKIAWQKAGIMKSGSRVYTVPQTPSALEVLKERSIERNCSSFEVIEPLRNLAVLNHFYPADIFNLNANLALALSQAWIDYKYSTATKSGGISESKDILSYEATTLGLLKFNWLGRYQILHDELNTFYVDGAHTEASVKICAEWFKEMTCTSARKKVLIFNATGDRNSEDLLKMLVDCKFEKVFFVPNKASANDISDMKNFNVGEDQQMARCQNHYKIWQSFNKHTATVQVLPTITDALKECSIDYNILITGSLHLVGAALSIISMSTKGTS